MASSSLIRFNIEILGFILGLVLKAMKFLLLLPISLIALFIEFLRRGITKLKGGKSPFKRTASKN